MKKKLREDLKILINSKIDIYLWWKIDKKELIKLLEIEIDIFKNSYSWNWAYMERLENYEIKCECWQIYKNPVTYCRDWCQRESIIPVWRI